MSMLNSPRYEEGNAECFSPDYVSFDATSPLAGKKIAFLGSSITAGFAAKDVSFVDYLAAKDGVAITKSAISGTTLAGLTEDGYLERLYHDFDQKQNYDLFVCQLSTNDYKNDKELGKITPASQKENFDCETTLGAIEEVARYITTELDCPLVFYTCPQIEPVEQYQELVDLLKKIQEKWHFKVIDLFNNQALMAATSAHPNAMFDNIHPTREGYLKLWLPVFEQELTQILNK
ncbi:SGNH/GDSL hydrolase family protein [Lactobacillus sp. PV034]|nr:SGNH/GDSL hydrolase family protein [Lactobacillus sp. PV034]